MIKNKWFIDKDTENRRIYHRIKKRFLSEKTNFQRVELIDTYSFGRLVVLDKKIQSAEKDEFIYHEVLVHPVMIAHPRPEKILILGGGEGATLREVVKHHTVRNVDMIDIDEEFVNLCKKHLFKWHKGAFNDKRTALIIADALDYIRETKNRYDVVIADISDPVEEGPAVMLYTKKFYSLVKKVLKPDGIFISHATDIDYVDFKKICSDIFKSLQKMFPKTALCYEYIPSFGSLWAFAIGSMKYDAAKLSSSLITKRLRERKILNLSYYDADTHQRMFIIPKCVRKLLGIA